MALNITFGLGGSGAALPLVANSAVGADRTVTIAMSDTVNLSGPGADPSAYSIVSNGMGVPVQVVSVIQDGSTIVLTTTSHTFGASYTVNLPSVGILSPDNGIFNGPFSLDFTGGPEPVVAVLISRSVDAHTIEVTFDHAVTEASASDPANYTIAGLSVEAAVMVTDYLYVLTTSRQTQGQVYGITLSNIEAK